MSFVLIPVIGLAALMFANAPDGGGDVPVHHPEHLLDSTVLVKEKTKPSIKLAKNVGAAKSKPKKAVKKSTVVVKETNDYLIKTYSVESLTLDSKLEYDTILDYIKNKFNKIQATDAHEISEYLVSFGKENDIDPKFAAAVIARESAFNKEAVSSTGAKGLGQIKDFNFKDLEIQDPFNIRDNVKGTTRYLKQMLSNWQKRMDTQATSEKVVVAPTSQTEKVKLALASYYKGFTAVTNDKGKLDEKTDGYVNDILSYYDELINLRQKQEIKN